MRPSHTKAWQSGRACSVGAFGSSLSSFRETPGFAQNPRTDSAKEDGRALPFSWRVGGYVLEDFAADDTEHTARLSPARRSRTPTGRSAT